MGERRLTVRALERACVDPRSLEANRYWVHHMTRLYGPDARYANN